MSLPSLGWEYKLPTIPQANIHVCPGWDISKSHNCGLGSTLQKQSTIPYPLPLPKNINSQPRANTAKKDLCELSHHSSAFLTITANLLNHIYLFYPWWSGWQSYSCSIPGHPKKDHHTGLKTRISAFYSLLWATDSLSLDLSFVYFLRAAQSFSFSFKYSKTHKIKAPGPMTNGCEKGCTFMVIHVHPQT